jgi:hypothetical protein
MLSDTMNYGAALSLILLLIIGFTCMFSNEEGEQTNQGII